MRFILNLILFAILFYLFWYFFPDAFKTVVGYGDKAAEYIKEQVDKARG